MEDFKMDNYFYQCPVCGFVHIIPAYWVSFNPEDEVALPHVNPQTQQDCDSILYLVK